MRSPITECTIVAVTRPVGLDKTAILDIDLIYKIGNQSFRVFLWEFRRGGLAQMVERSLSMWEVPGSIPGFSIFQSFLHIYSSFLLLCSNSENVDIGTSVCVRVCVCMSVCGRACVACNRFYTSVCAGVYVCVFWARYARVCCARICVHLRACVRVHARACRPMCMHVCACVWVGTDACMRVRAYVTLDQKHIEGRPAWLWTVLLKWTFTTIQLLQATVGPILKHLSHKNS